MEVGVTVWVLNPDTEDDELVWLPGEITRKEVRNSDNYEVGIKARGRVWEQLSVASDNGELPGVQLRREGEEVEDLIRLTFLHEPAILHTLQMRFEASLIYTYTGPILIAVNPFQPLDLYTDDILEAYYEGGVARSQGFDSSPMPPHVYAIAANAYQDMSIRLVKMRASKKNSPVKGGRPAALPSMYTRPATKAVETKSEDSISQSILISGESGSGKTVSTKHCLEYLTTVGQTAGNCSKGLKSASMQRDIDSNKIVQSNPILEAFGNARTLRNDNSSRFGKLVQLHFGGDGDFLGGSISSYLLEKVRLASQTKGERNFHIFYQLCAAGSGSLTRRVSSAAHAHVRPKTSSTFNKASSIPFASSARQRTSSIGADSRRESWNGGNRQGGPPLNQELVSDEARLEGKWNLRSAKEFYYANQGGVFVLRDVDDGSELENLRFAMHVLGFTPSETSQSFNVAASLLHLGEVSFVEGQNYESLLDGEYAMSAARKFSELIGVDFEAFKKTVTVKDVSTKWETVVKDLRPVDALHARDALATALYSRLFDWLVEKVNTSLGVQQASLIEASVSVLDIFGFENFHVNSLEQLCINYTNEKLQQHFNNYVFKLEEAEYTREGIEWSLVDFPDNTDILDMIEGKKPMGILALLDDECGNPNGNDKSFTQRIYSAFLGDEAGEVGSQATRGKRNGTSNPAQLEFSLLSLRNSASGSVEGLGKGKHARFDATPLMKPLGQFSVIHYAGPVTYCATGFWAKNRDELPSQAVKLLQGSTNAFISSLFAVDGEESAPLSSGRAQGASAASLFNPTSKQAAAMGRKSSPVGKQAHRTVATKFKSQLTDLMERLSVTQPHYIRCLKPNETAEPFVYNHRRVGEQLRYGGVLEAVRVSRSGFPVRMTHGDFYERYRRLVSGVTRSPEKDVEHIHNRVSSAIRSSVSGDVPLLPLSVSHFAPDEVEKVTKTLTKMIATSPATSKDEEYDSAAVQFGLSKVFLRKKAHDALEARVVCRRRRSSIYLQALARGSIVHIEYVKTLQSALLLNRCFRMVRVRFRFLQLRRAAIVLQCKNRTMVAIRLRKRLAIEMKDVNLQRAKEQTRVAKLAEERAESERMAVKLKEEVERKAAEAAAEAAKKDSVKRTIQRTANRFAYAMPLAYAMQKWARHAKWAYKEAQAAKAAALAKASANQVTALEDELLKERAALRAERMKAETTEEELKSKVQQFERTATMDKAEREDKELITERARRKGLEKTTKRSLMKWLRYTPLTSAMQTWVRYTKFATVEAHRSSFAASSLDSKSRLVQLEDELIKERTERKAERIIADGAKEELEAKVLQLERAASRERAEHEEERTRLEFKLKGVAAQAVALERELTAERDLRQSDQTKCQATGEDLQARLTRLEASAAEERTKAESSQKELEAKVILLERTASREGAERENEHAEAEAKAIQVAALECVLVEERDLRKLEKAKFQAAEEDFQARLTRLETSSAEDLAILIAEVDCAKDEYDALLRTTFQKEEAQLETRAMEKKALDALRKEAGAATMRRAASRWFRSGPLAAAIKTWVRCTKLSADEAHKARYAATSLDSKSTAAALEDELLKERAERRTERSKAEDIQEDLEAKMLQIERAASRGRMEREEEQSEAEVAKVEFQKKSARLQEELEEAQFKLHALEKVLSQDRLERQEQHDMHISMAATAAHAAQRTIAELCDEVSSMKEELVNERSAHSSTQENNEREHATKVEFLEETLNRVREERQQEELSLKSFSAAAAERAKATIDDLKAELANVQDELVRETTSRAADRSADDMRLGSSKVALEVLNAQVSALEETLSLERAERDSERAAAQLEFDHTVACHEAKQRALREALAREEAERAADVAAGQSVAKKLRDNLVEFEEELMQVSSEHDAAVASAAADADDYRAAVSALELKLQREQGERADDAQAHARTAAEADARAQEATNALRVQVDALVEAAASERAKRAAERLAFEAACEADVDRLKQRASALEGSLSEALDAKEREGLRSAKLASTAEALQFEVEALGKQLAAEVSGRAAESAQASASLGALQAKARDVAASLAKEQRQRADEQERASLAAQSAEDVKRLLAAQRKELETSRADRQAEAAAAKHQVDHLQVQALVLDEKLAREVDGRRKDQAAQAAAVAAVEARAKAMTEELRGQVTGLIEATRRERAGRSAEKAADGHLQATRGAHAAAAVDTRAQVATLEEALARESAKLADALAKQADAAADARAADTRAREATYAAQAGGEAAALSDALAASRSELRGVRAERDALAVELDQGAATWQARGLAAAASTYRAPRSPLLLAMGRGGSSSPSSDRGGGGGRGGDASSPRAAAAREREPLDRGDASSLTSSPTGSPPPQSRGLQLALVSLVERAEADAAALREDVARLEAQLAAAQAQAPVAAGRHWQSRATSPVAFAERARDNYQPGVFGRSSPPPPSALSSPHPNDDDALQKSERKARELERQVATLRAQVNGLSDSAQVAAMREQLQAAASTFERILLAAEQEHASEADGLRDAVAALERRVAQDAAAAEQQRRREVAALRGLLATQDAETAQRQAAWQAEKEDLARAADQAQAQRDRASAANLQREQRLVKEKEVDVENALEWLRREQQAKQALEDELTRCEETLQLEQHERASLEDAVASSLHQFYTATPPMAQGDRGGGGGGHRGSGGGRSGGAFQTPSQASRAGSPHLTPSSRGGGGGPSASRLVSPRPASPFRPATSRPDPPRSASAPRFARAAGPPLLLPAASYEREPRPASPQRSPANMSPRLAAPPRAGPAAAASFSAALQRPLRSNPTGNSLGDVFAGTSILRMQQNYRG